MKVISGMKCIMITLIVLVLPVSGYSIHVSFFLGDVKLIRNGGTLSINMGDVLENGDVIETGNRSEATLLYKDDSKIVVKENSKIQIGSKSMKDSDDVALISGNLTGKFTKLAKDSSSRRVYNPTTVCAIRGTEFELGVSKKGDSRVDLKEGNMQISNPYGSTDLKENQKTETGVNEKPSRSKLSGVMGDWKSKEDKELDKNPEKVGKNYDNYMKTFGKRSSDDSGSIGKSGTQVKDAKTKEDIEKAGKNIDSTEQKVRDDMMLNQSANSSIEGVLNDYKDRKGNIYDIFAKVKAESNKVLEQQQRNYEEIQKVKQAYRDAYDKIMGKFQEDKDRIFKGFKRDDLKPKLKEDK